MGSANARLLPGRTFEEKMRLGGSLALPDRLHAIALPRFAAIRPRRDLNARRVYISGVTAGTEARHGAKR
jgi:hypothetical protein